VRAIALIIAVLLVGCDKKDAPATTAAPASSSAPAASASVAPEETATTVKGSYSAKQGEVRTPSDAPKFGHPEVQEGIGDGELEVTLPPKHGEVTGKAKGALGAQVFSGWLEDGRLTGTLTPAEGSSPPMWGYVEGAVEGNSVKGTIRASGADGSVVREASFTLDKK
jgi:hypothetical protein